MIEPNVIMEVERLLAGGTLSQKKIAAVTRVSRGLVSAIASGKRRIKQKRLVRKPDSNVGTDENGHLFYYPSGPMARCPVCGAVVRTPCLACQIENREQMSHESPKILANFVSEV